MHQGKATFFLTDAYFQSLVMSGVDNLDQLVIQQPKAQDSFWTTLAFGSAPRKKGLIVICDPKKKKFRQV